MIRFSCRNRSRAAFTLLEVMLAVAILLFISLALTRFTESTIQAAQASVRGSDQDEACAGLRRLLAAQLASLSPNQSGALMGMTIEESHASRSVLQMVCPSGNAVLTPDAKGFYEVTLMTRENPRGSGKKSLVMSRQPWIDDDADDSDDETTAVTPLKTANAAHPAVALPSDSVTLLDGVSDFELSYFDARLNGWVDRWTDSTLLPNLVRVRLTLVKGQAPYEIIERVPAGGLKPLPPPVAAPVPVPNANGGNANVPVNPPAGGPATRPPAIQR